MHVSHSSKVFTLALSRLKMQVIILTHSLTLVFNTEKNLIREIKLRSLKAQNTIQRKLTYYMILRMNITKNKMKTKKKNMMKNKMMTKNKMMKKSKNMTKNKMVTKRQMMMKNNKMMKNKNMINQALFQLILSPTSRLRIILVKNLIRQKMLEKLKSSKQDYQKLKKSMKILKRS